MESMINKETKMSVLGGTTMSKVKTIVHRSSESGVGLEPGGTVMLPLGEPGGPDTLPLGEPGGTDTLPLGEQRQLLPE